MKRAGLLLVLLAAALAAAVSAESKTSGLLAIVGQGSSARLGHLDPATLKLVGRSTQVGYYTWPSDRSPDGARIALARGDVRDGIRIVDMRRMRTVRAFAIGAGHPQALAWVAPRKLVVAANGLVVAAVDPVTGKRLWQRMLPMFFQRVARASGGFVFLSSPADDVQNTIGKTTLTTVSWNGVVRSVLLDRIVTGLREPDESTPLGTQRLAGLAVDVAGNRAVVVGAGEPVAEVDLTTLAVTYHGGTRTLSKLLDGPTREATWLPNGTVAVTGYDGHVGKDANGNMTESETPAGLWILDPRDWSARMVDPSADSLEVAGRTLVAYSWSSGAGVRVYGADGTPRLQALSGAVEDVQIGGNMAFAATGSTLNVVDLGSGRVVSRKPYTNILLVP
jgi:hypothetical protein